MSSPAFRWGILDAARDVLNGKFNSATGTESKIFREVRCGVLRPRADVWPTLTVHDGGQRRAEADLDESAEAEERLLVVLATCQIAENWERETNRENWSERVERIVAALHNYNTSRGAVTFRYVRDEPAMAFFFSGESAAVWEIEFEAHYFVDASKLDPTL